MSAAHEALTRAHLQIHTLIDLHVGDPRTAVSELRDCARVHRMAGDLDEAELLDMHACNLERHIRNREGITT